MSLYLPASGSFHIIRGGCWYDVLQFARVAARSSVAPDVRDDTLCVRLVWRCL